MRPVLLLTNPVRDYPWGSTTAIPEVLGLEADGRPQAEMWMGAHPASPSTCDGRRLDEVVEADPRGVLGQRVSDRFGPRLPYLMKLLAAAEPLSIQAHPSEEQAREGFAREEAAGVPRDAGHRLYKDEHHKPEMVVALTDFEALCGFREPARAAEVLRGLDVPGLGRLVTVLEGPDAGAALREALGLLLDPDGPGPAWAAPVARACADRLRAGSPCADDDRTVVELAERHPQDPGVLVALLLHRVHLAPGQALALGPGNVHAYLHGTGVELMAASDNVLRGGLTGKHVDARELQRVVDFRPVPVPRVPAEDLPLGGGPARARRWRPGFPELELTRVAPAGAVVPLEADGPRLVLCTEGAVELRAGDTSTPLPRGASALVRDDEGPLAVAGEGVAWVASVPPWES